MAASYADNELWHVMLAEDMKRMNVDQLDDAFRLSLVDASTMVWKAGMKTWQRLGSVAGIEDDEVEDSVTRLVAAAPPPPPQRAQSRPVPKPPSPRSLAPLPTPAPRTVPPAPRTVPPAPRAMPYSAPPAPRAMPYSAPPPPLAAPRTAPPPPLAAPRSVPPAPRAVPNPFLSTAPAPVFQQRLVAPVYTPPVAAPDPFTLPKRRASIPSEVDFRRKSGGVRWGRWLVAVLLLTGGVLGAYRQNLLREGARRLGVENKYLYGERRVTSFVNAKAPFAVKSALGKLALLPGPNAEPAAARKAAPSPPAPVAKVEPSPAPVAAPVVEPKPSEPDVKTVSLDSLPVLAETAAATPPPAAVAPSKARSVAPKPEKAAVVAKSRAKSVAKAEPSPKAEPKPKAPPASVANDNPLKAAIRSAIAADAGK